MRISDWSSDVCSSDLMQRAMQGHAAVFRTGESLAEGVDNLNAAWAKRGEVVAEKNGNPSTVVRSEERREGKSVSVRVDLGGRRIIKKKKRKQTKKVHLRKRNTIT